MRVDISPILKEPGLKFNYETSELLQEPDFRLQGPVSLQLTLTNVGRGIHAEGTAVGKVLHGCANCLSEFALPVEAVISEEFLPESAARAQTGGDPVLEELSIFTYGDNHLLEFDEAVRQAILLNLPMRPLCKPDCKGLCSVCGRNKNEGECACALEITDDRWGPLKAVKFSARPRSE